MTEKGPPKIHSSIKVTRILAKIVKLNFFRALELKGLQQPKGH